MIKKSDKVLTVIIPTYNIEEYLDRCLNSFVNEKLLPYIEIIVVNDGSTDLSLQIANKYFREYPLSFVVIDKENGGHGSTINVGLKKASGKYIMVVDGDDWVDNDSLLKVVTFLSKNNIDALFLNSFVNIQSNGSIRRNSLKKIFSNAGFVNLNSAKLNIYKQISLANIIYNTKNLKDINLRLLEKTYYVDIEYMIYPLRTIKNCYYMDEYIYHYMIGRPNQSININVALKHIHDRKKVIESVLLYNSRINKNDFSYFAKQFYYSKISSVVNDYYDILIRGKEDFSKNIEKTNIFIRNIDDNLYEYIEKQYFYIKMSRLFKYSKTIIVISFYIDRLIKKIIRFLIRRF